MPLSRLALFLVPAGCPGPSALRSLAVWPMPVPPREETTRQEVAGYRTAGGYWLCSVDVICDRSDHSYKFHRTGNGQDDTEKRAYWFACIDAAAQCYAEGGVMRGESAYNRRCTHVPRGDD